MTTEREKFEESFQDWMIGYGKPTWDANAEIYKEQHWQMAWVGWLRGAGLTSRGRKQQAAIVG